MKKNFLVLIALFTCGIAFSQQSLPARNEAASMRMKGLTLQDGVPSPNPLMISHVLNHGGGLRDLTEKKFSSSHNGFMLLVSESQCLTANNDLKLISFTQRACESIVLNGGNSGWIQSSFSTDMGQTFDTGLVVMNSLTAFCRYPSGGIYNPAGNTDPLSAYTVVAGPITDNTDWVQYYYGSMRFDSTQNDQQFYDNQTDNIFQQMPRLSFTTCGDKAFVLGSDYDFNTAPLFNEYRGGVINRGVFNNSINAFDWTRTEVHVPYALDNTGLQQQGNFGNLAYNEDGSVGYFITLGVDSANPVGYYPIIYKSTDFGVSWNALPFYDFSTMPVWADYLFPTVDGLTIKPFFSSSNGIDAVVDHNGELHIICGMYSSFSNHPDSLGFIYSTKPLIFDVHQASDVWEAIFIDSLQSVNGVSALWTSTTGTIGSDARIQAATSPDHSKIMVIWADTDPALGSVINDYPDLKGAGIDMGNGGTNTGVINFTSNTNYTTINWWHYVSDRAIDAGNGIFTVPVTISQSRDGSYVMDNVMDHYYVSDITFPFITGTSDVEHPSFNVGQNYPNPFSNQTSLSITLDKSAAVNLKVTDILGQEVYLKDFTYSAGNHQLVINRNNLANGIYNCTVTADGMEVTRTLVVQ